MDFLKKLRFWKRRRNNAVTSRDIAATTDNLTMETGTQVLSIEMILRRDAGTQVDSSLTREASTQTSNRNEKPKNRTYGGAADKEREELKRKITALENILEENDRQIQEQNKTIKEMKERLRSEIQYIRTKEEIEKRSLLQKIRHMRDEIISLEERRPPKAKRAEPSAEQESLGPGWNHVVSGGRVKAATPKSAPEVTVGPKQAPLTENQRSDHTGRS
jgi:chromosome segregation ATPase